MTPDLLYVSSFPISEVGCGPLPKFDSFVSGTGRNRSTSSGGSELIFAEDDEFRLFASTSESLVRTLPLASPAGLEFIFLFLRKKISGVRIYIGLRLFSSISSAVLPFAEL